MKKLDIFGKKIPIKYKDLSKEDHDGAYVYDKNHVYIHKDLEKDMYIHVLLHEAGHALFDRLFKQAGIPHSLEEVIVEAYTVMLLDNFKVSPKK